MTTHPAAATSARARKPYPASAVALAVLVVLMLPVALFTGGQAGRQSTEAVIGGFALALMFLTMAAVGLVVARFQPRNAVGYLMLGGAACFLLTLISGGYATLVFPLHRRLPLGDVALLLSPLGLAAIVMLPMIILLFPDGRLPSARWRVLTWTAVALLGYTVAANEVAITVAILGHRLRVTSAGQAVLPGPVSASVTLASVLAIAALCAGAVIRQVVAWRRASADRRQQIKWLMAGTGVFIVIGVPSLAVSSDLWEAGIAVGFAALPLAIGVGILRYRLYDVDRIVSRTVSYAILTAVLAGTYVGLVLLVTQVLSFSSEVAVATSTLVAAALFNPLRRRFQHVVDRRFNRTRYDAELTVGAFAARLQDAVDLDEVRADLADTVRRTLEPEHLALWTARQVQP